MPVDFAWMPSGGGLLVDGAGDIATTSPATIDDIRSIVMTRLRAALNAYLLYPGMGADLQMLVGGTAGPEMETTIQRQAQQCLINDFLPRGTFQVQTLRVAGTIQVIVFLNQQVLAQAVITNLAAVNPTVTVIA